jgi:hypothetical protein
MDQTDSLEISYDEWRSFFMINPAILESVTGDPNEMLRYWRGATVCYILFSKTKLYLFLCHFISF